MTLVVWIGLTLLGGVGAVLRFVVDGTVGRRMSGTMPYGTLVVNLSGAALLGLLVGLAPSKDAALLLGTGVLGAYTTFSTWMFETQRLVEERQLARAALNIAVSVAAGVATAALGLWIGGRL
ncbi:MAG: fluoride efflux transporter CrcB [Actinomycetota bacterium]|nr:fluoride efflux transporter CrcB [Actinomycetota bacterium]